MFPDLTHGGTTMQTTGTFWALLQRKRIAAVTRRVIKFDLYQAKFPKEEVKATQALL
jgi:hypothetical protein